MNSSFIYKDALLRRYLGKSNDSAEKKVEENERKFSEQEGKIISVSPWLLALKDEACGQGGDALAERKLEGIQFCAYAGRDSLWINARFENGGRMLFRAAYSPGLNFTVESTRPRDDGVEVVISSAIGRLRSHLIFPDPQRALVRWTTWLTPAEALQIPYFPRDIYMLDATGNPLTVEGQVHATQHGPAAPFVYASLTQPASGTLYYINNLTALNDYFEYTQADPMQAVRNDWPELGFALPPGKEDKSLPAGQEICIADAFALLTNQLPADEFEAAELFVDMVADVYLHYPRPEWRYRDWIKRTEESLQDMARSKKCSKQVGGKTYMMPYVNAQDKVPESMVQLAILLPLAEYSEWRGRKVPLADRIKENLSTFYDPKVKSVVRWLPGQPLPEDGEEQEHHEVMDSWYLYHTLHNMGRLAARGDQGARKLFFDSLEFAIKVAQTMNYDFPVFYNFNTLDVIKAETAPGKGGEHDVGCVYIQTMITAFDLTQDRRYIDEATRAAEAMRGYGFNLLYQTNITAFGMSALYRLYKETGNDLYRLMSLVCLAGVVTSLWLWDCDYGYGKHYQTFMGALPLRNAPYLASYEESEISSGCLTYLEVSEYTLPRSAQMLMAEFMRYALDTTWYDYPSELPEEMLSQHPKTGEIDRELYIPMEDLYTGWQQAGQVGQEVYGCGGIFNLTARHYNRAGDLPFIIYCSYPSGDLKISADGQGGKMAEMMVGGDERLTCMARLIPIDRQPLPELTFTAERDGDGQPIQGERTAEGELVFTLHGNQHMRVQFKDSGKRSNDGASRQVNGHQKSK